MSKLKVGNWMISRLNNYEVVLFLVFFIFSFINLTTNGSFGIIIIIALLTLSTFYFFTGFADLNDEYAGGLEIFIHKLVSWALSVSLVGVLFITQGWAKSSLLLLLGSCTLLCCLPIILWSNKKKPELKVFNARFLLRVIIICALGFFLVIAGRKFLIEKQLVKIHKIEDIR